MLLHTTPTANGLRRRLTATMLSLLLAGNAAAFSEGPSCSLKLDPVAIRAAFVAGSRSAVLCLAQYGHSAARHLECVERVDSQLISNGCLQKKGADALRCDILTRLSDVSFTANATPLTLCLRDQVIRAIVSTD